MDLDEMFETDGSDEEESECRMLLEVALDKTREHCGEDAMDAALRGVTPGVGVRITVPQMDDSDSDALEETISGLSGIESARVHEGAEEWHIDARVGDGTMSQSDLEDVAERVRTAIEDSGIETATGYSVIG
jgi:hypothetical protein